MAAIFRTGALRASGGRSAAGHTARRTDRTAPLVAAGAALVLAVSYLIAPLMGGDLSAQLARADFARHHPFTPVDLRWFASFQPFGYSSWPPWLMAAIGVRLTGAIATVASAWLTCRLMQRAGAARPAWGGVATAVTLTSNLVEGRVTFACGVVFGLAALLLVGRSRVGLITAAFLAGAASPVAALLLGVCAAALLVHRRIRDALLLAVPAMVPAGVLTLVFTDPGRGLFSPNDALRAVAMSALVALLLPRRQLLIRSGALIGALMVLVLWLVPTPVGVSAARLTLLFAVPIVVAFAPLARPLVPLAVVVAVLVQSPVTIGTLKVAGRPATAAGYYRPLLDEVARRGQLTGRVEVPELTGHWEAAYLARQVPLARGWLRQTDIEQNDDVFYEQPPTAASYRAFLDRTAVQFVAVADAPATFYGRREARLVSAGLPYLHEIWSNAHWRLYEVQKAAPIVSAPGRLVSSTASSLTVAAPAASTIRLRIRWFDWLSVDSGGCIRRSGDDVLLQAHDTRTFTISSSLPSGSRHCT